MRVKICGITNEADALSAIEAGADALGFNFWPRSRRALIPPEHAFHVPEWIGALGQTGVRRIAVVVNAGEELLRAIEQSGAFDAVQFHGDESPGDCAHCGLPWWKALPAGKGGGPAFHDGGFSAAEAWVIDAPAPPGIYGGTGTPGDWSIAADVIRENPGRLIYLAGGLRPENVAEAIRIARPGGVDVAGGVEGTDPRRKDPVKIRDFVRAAKESRLG